MNSIIQRTLSRLRFAHRGWRYRLRAERAEVAFLLRYYQPDKTGIDIGAHKGAFTYWMLRKSQRGARVLAFEPLPAMAAYLREVQEDGGARGLAIEQVALSDRCGPRTLYRPRNDYLGMTSFTRLDHKNGYDELTVETTTLDEYFDCHGGRPVGFIKCDVEGHELEVLRGATRILTEDQPTMLLECEDHRHGGGQLERVTRYLRPLGYHCFALFRTGIRPLQECQAEMATLRVGIDGYRSFGFLPRALADRLMTESQRWNYSQRAA